MPLPPLPKATLERSDGISQIIAILTSHYESTASILRSGQYNRHRLQHHENMLLTDVFPMLIVLEESAEQENLPLSWIEETAKVFVGMFTEVSSLNSETTEGPSNVCIPEVVSIERVRRPGRPRKVINPEVLQEALHPTRGITQAALARALKVHRNTLRRKIKELGVSITYTDISDEELDDIVKAYSVSHPSSGRRYLMGFLRSHGIRVKRARLVASVARVDQLGRLLRGRRAAKKKRKAYQVARPNALWHMDGHHKLIHWGIVIHGVVDGYSRKITGIRASNNNRASTVLEMFMDAILEHGLPSRVRADRGGENKDVAILMMILRGLNRASFMWGSSIFNTRIERLWVEAGSQFVRLWRAFFRRLERLHLLDRKNPRHLWLLHHLFLAEINTDCQDFQHNWNSHGISGVGKNQSPNDIDFMGKLKAGVYVEDELEKLDEDEIRKYYGVDYCSSDGGSDDADDEGAGSEDMDVDRDEELEDEEAMELEEDQNEEEVEAEENAGDEAMEWQGDEDDADSSMEGGEVNDADEGSDGPGAECYARAEAVKLNIRHDPVAVPRHACPFTSPMALETFLANHRAVCESGLLPVGYGVRADEWDPVEGYPANEDIPYGKGGKSSLTVALPQERWLPKAETWATALFTMNILLGG